LGETAEVRFAGGADWGIEFALVRNRWLIFRENLTGKAENLQLGIAGGFARQSSLAAGFLEEFLRVEVMFDGDLWEKKPAMLPESHEQTVTPDFDRFP